MIKVEDITSEQLDAIVLDLDKELLISKCIELQDIIHKEKPTESPYAVPENVVANHYCIAKKDTMQHSEDSVEWYTEWDTLHFKVMGVCREINAILATVPETPVTE